MINFHFVLLEKFCILGTTILCQNLVKVLLGGCLGDFLQQNLVTLALSHSRSRPEVVIFQIITVGAISGQEPEASTAYRTSGTGKIVLT
jgi:hypothetical protein